MNDLEIITSLKSLVNNIYDGPEGVYNECSLVEELINYLYRRNRISIDEWYVNFKVWEKYVKKSIDKEIHTLSLMIIEGDDEEECKELEKEMKTWKKYLNTFQDRMDLLYDFAEIIFKEMV